MTLENSDFDKEYRHIQRQNRHRLIGAIVVVGVAATFLIWAIGRHQASLSPTQTPPQNTTIITPQQPIMATPTESDDVLAEWIDQSLPATSLSNETNTSTEVGHIPTPAPSLAIEKKQSAPSAAPQYHSTRDPKAILEGRNRISLATPTTTNNQASYIVQIGAFAMMDLAQDRQRRLAQMGIPTIISHIVTPRGDIYRVHTKAYASQNDAERIYQSVHAAGMDAIVVTY